MGEKAVDEYLEDDDNDGNIFDGEGQQYINSLENFISDQFYTTIINREVNIAVKAEFTNIKLNELKVINKDGTCKESIDYTPHCNKL